MKTAKVALLGNPNCGKSTLCNALTGSKLRVGNWPGVTVERKSGYFDYEDWRIEIVDLPGVYNLTTFAGDGSIDSRIACEAILSDEFNLVLNVVDASNLERNLYLTTQLLTLKMPVVVIANMLDVAARNGNSLDLNALESTLGCPVIGLNATRSQLEPLKQTLLAALASNTYPVEVAKLPPTLEMAVNRIADKISSSVPEKVSRSRFLSLQLLEGDELVKHLLPQDTQQLASEQRQLLEASGELDLDLQIADVRYGFAHNACISTIKRQQQPVSSSWGEWVDKIVLNRFLGIPIFLAVMYALFFFSINLAGVLQPFFDGVSNAIFVHGFSQLLLSCHAPGWLVGVLGVGLGTSINTVLTFVPVIGALFLFLAVLESSGYMVRAAFVIDRLMRAMGLPGKAFVPLIVGFGCNVPAILATRTLEHQRDRLLTLMMTPFMSCGARMAIYTVFTAAFFPQGGQNIVFALYLIGICMAMLTGFILRKTVLKGDCSPWIVELPPYHLPKSSAILRLTWQRLRQFLFKAGKLIIPICLIISSLNAIHLNGKLDINNTDSDSLLSVAGQKLTPLFSPMGIQPENWPATVGLMTGVLAKEVVVGTLNTLYTQVGHLNSTETNQNFNLLTSLEAAVATIPAQWLALKDSFRNPIAASAADSQVNDGVLGLMYQHFDGTAGAMAYLLFVLLYFPCVSATAALMRESNFRWAAFSVFWTTALAYGTAVVFYQSVTWQRHPASASMWILGVLAVFAGILSIIIRYAASSKTAYSDLSLNTKSGFS